MSETRKRLHSEANTPVQAFYDLCEANDIENVTKFLKRPISVDTIVKGVCNAPTPEMRDILCDHIPDDTDYFNIVLRSREVKQVGASLQSLFTNGMLYEGIYFVSFKL